MGHRANYAIREHGKVELYYSRWGALTVAEDVFWGPARTQAFIRDNEPTADWLDNVWAEGGIALDKDNRRLTYYYFEWPDEEDIRRVYESRLEDTWRVDGWSVERASTWQDLAAAVGVDPNWVTAVPTGPPTIGFEQLGQNLERPCCCGLLSVKTEQSWEDCAIDFVLPGVLMNGPALISRLAAVAGLAKLRAAFLRRPPDDSAKTLGDWLDEFCAIDVQAREVRMSLPEHEEQDLPFLREAWPGWTVRLERGGAREHFAHTGREMPSDFEPSPKPPAPQPPNRSYEECVRLIRERLDGNETQKSELLAGHVTFIQKLNQERGPITVAPGFLHRVPSSQPTLFDRLRLALRLRWRRFKT